MPGKGAETGPENATISDVYSSGVLDQETTLPDHISDRLCCGVCWVISPRSHNQLLVTLKIIRISYRILSWGVKQDGSRMIVACESTLTHV